jgi:hypothetical protein
MMPERCQSGAAMLCRMTLMVGSCDGHHSRELWVLPSAALVFNPGMGLMSVSQSFWICQAPLAWNREPLATLSPAQPYFPAHQWHVPQRVLFVPSAVAQGQYDLQLTFW